MDCLGDALLSGEDAGDDRAELLKALPHPALVSLIPPAARNAVVGVQNLLKGVKGVPKERALAPLLVKLRHSSLFDNAHPQRLGNLLQKALFRAGFLLLAYAVQIHVLLTVISEAAHAESRDVALFDSGPHASVGYLHGHKPRPLADFLSVDVEIRLGNPVLHNGRAVQRLEAVLQVNLVAVLGKPVRGLGDLLLRHKVAVTVLLHRFIDNPGDVVILRVRFDDPAVGRERRLAAVPFLEEELPLVRCLVYEGNKLDFRVGDLVCFSQAPGHASLTSFHGTWKI